MLTCRKRCSATSHCVPQASLVFFTSTTHAWATGGAGATGPATTSLGTHSFHLLLRELLNLENAAEAQKMGQEVQSSMPQGQKSCKWAVGSV